MTGRMFKVALIVLLAFSMVGSLLGCEQGSVNGGDDGGDNGTGPEFVWTLASNYNDPKVKFDSFGGSQQLFADLVEARSGGRMKIETHYSNALGTPPEIYEMARRGEVEFFYGQPRSTVDPRFGALSIPYLFKNRDEVEKLVVTPGAPIFKLTEKWLAENDMVLLASGASIFRDFVNTKRTVRLPNDIKDMKVRVYEDAVVQTFWSEMANAVPMAFQEVITALDAGTVDAMEFAPSGVLNYGVWEVVDYYTNIGWQWNWGANLMVTKQAWDTIPSDLQDIVRLSAEDAMYYQSAVERIDSANAIDQLREKGLEIYLLNDEELKAWMDAAQAIAPKMKEVIGPAVYDEIVKIVEDSRK